MPGSNDGTGSETDRRVPVWDAVVRSTHWAVAALVILDWIRDDGDWWHRQTGYVAAGLVFLRLLWASFRPGHAGLAALKPSLSATRDYLRSEAPRTLGHNPLGVWMIWWLWSLILLLALSGWMSRLDAFWGDDRVHDIHAWLADTLMVSAIVHVSGTVVMSFRWRENLLTALMGGRKRPPDGS